MSTNDKLDSLFALYDNTVIKDIKSRIFQEARFMGYDSEESKAVVNILREVAEKGDQAVADFTNKFDNVRLAPEDLKIPEKELINAQTTLEKQDPALLNSIRRAIQNVRKYQSEIFWGDKIRHKGLKITPLKSVGVCVPGASAPLPSTVIMTVVPAQVAGVKQIVVVSPPRCAGTIHPVILAVCRELGVTEVFRIGGAQAVAALAHGTERIPKVDKIVGPGNKWVQTAKKNVFGYVDIDSIAGPSEVLILASEEAKAPWVAADMLSQAEHAPGSAVLFTLSETFAKKVLEEIKKQVLKLHRSKETLECLLQYGKIVVFPDMETIIKEANDFASEHLQIQCGRQNKEIADKISNAGAIFIGDYSPVAVGDYWAGPSHTLPTGTSAKFFSALSSNDFIKSTSMIEYTEKQLKDSAEDIIRLAEIEGLDAHAKSVQKRIDK